jgi:hypothetical protein
MPELRVRGHNLEACFGSLQLAGEPHAHMAID